MSDPVSHSVQLVILVPFLAAILGLLVSRNRAVSAFVASAGATVSPSWQPSTAAVPCRCLWAMPGSA